MKPITWNTLIWLIILIVDFNAMWYLGEWINTKLEAGATYPLVPGTEWMVQSLMVSMLILLQALIYAVYYALFKEYNLKVTYSKN
jgi:hypothetical protein